MLQNESLLRHHLANSCMTANVAVVAHKLRFDFRQLEQWLAEENKNSLSDF